jgi:ribonuclease J
MSIEIIPLGGFSEVGRNAVAIKVDEEVVICDLGLMLDKYIEYTDTDEPIEISGRKLIEVGAAPDVGILGDLRKNVVGICISHGHLDHVGAVPYLANQFDADIHATPMTCEVIKNLTVRDRRPIKNRIVQHPINSKFKLTKNIEVEFIHITHSIPHTVAVTLHTPYGTVIYMNDFKIDNHPMLGQKSNLKRLKELEGAKCLIIDSLYAHLPEKAPSERFAQEMLFDTVLNTDTKGKAVVITTFSSHIARLKAIVELGHKMRRRVVFLGRSMDKYLTAAENAGLVDFKKKVKIVAGRAQVDTWLKRNPNLSNVLLVMTGHQGEPKAVLARTIDQGLLKLGSGDLVVYSCKIIPVEVNIENRHRLDERLRQQHVRIFNDIHVSGHGAREDHRELLTLLKPEHLIPTHGGMRQLGALKELAVHDLGYKPENVHILANGQRLKIVE